MKVRFNSLQFKISVLSMLILALVLILYSGFLFMTFRYTLYDELDDSLRVKAQKINNAIVSYLDVLGYDPRSFEFAATRIVAQKGAHPHMNKIEKLEKLWRGQVQPLGLENDRIAVLDAAGRTVAHSENLPAGRLFSLPKGTRWIEKGRADFRNIHLSDKPFRVIAMPVTYENLRKEKQYLIVIAGSRDRVIGILRERLIVKAAAIFLVLAVASVLSRLFARRILRPVQDITRVARNINYRDLSLRIRTEGVDSEMKDLADSLNEMMSRLEKSFKYIAEFSSHVSHELKTPLAIMRGESELALRAGHSPEEYQKTIQSIYEEIIRMSRIIEDLLLLTRLDYQPQVFKFETFDLAEFFKELTESVRILADQKKIQVEFRLPAKAVPLRGDPVHLRRLVFNLINNAIKFTHPGGAVTVEVKKNGADALISVADTGVGIPAEFLPKIFDKFFHYNELTMTDAQGNGLGLSIAQSIVKIHSGDIQVESAVGKGSTFTVRLPLPGG